MMNAIILKKNFFQALLEFLKFRDTKIYHPTDDMFES